MAAVFSKNAILVGTVNYFCLVCETHLKSERDTDVHISKPVHQKQLEAIQYVEEFKAEGIKKIKNKYFCEVCNKVLTVPARVRLHVAEPSHARTKYKDSFKRIGSYITAFGKVAICDQSWNGLSEKACAMCDIEYEDEEIHKNQSTHILNVVQLQVDTDNDQNVYREIDHLHCQCLTCNKVLALNSLTSHFVGDEHKTLYQACCDAYNNITLDTHPDKTIKDETTKSETIKKEATKNDPESIENDNINYTKASSPRVNKKNRNTNKVIKENVQKDTQLDKTIKDETTKSENIKKEATKNDPESIGNDNISYTKASTPRVNKKNRKLKKVIKENVQKDTHPGKTIKDETTKSETIKKEATNNDSDSIGNNNIPGAKASKPGVKNQNWYINKVIKENVHQAILDSSKIYLQQNMETNTTTSNEKEHAQKYADMILENPDKIVDIVSGPIEKCFSASENGSKPNKLGPKGIKKTVFSTPVLMTYNNEERNEDFRSNVKIMVEIYEIG